jgi:mRNA interferase MazF
MMKTRPVVIISPNAMNGNLKMVIIAPLTQTIKGYPSRVPTHFGVRQGEVVLDQIRAVEKSRLKRKQGTIDAITASNIKSAPATMFS